MERVYRIQKIQKDGNGVVHSVIKVVPRHGTGNYFLTRCDNTLMDEGTKKGLSDVSGRNAAYAPTQRPVTCKICLREIHKEVYVKKLEKILNKYSIEQISFRCPSLMMEKSCTAVTTKKMCRMCQKFVGLPFIYSTSGDSCPCNRLRSTEAIARARASIKKYKKE